MLCNYHVEEYSERREMFYNFCAIHLCLATIMSVVRRWICDWFNFSPPWVINY
jgi:hypothetical protein